MWRIIHSIGLPPAQQGRERTGGADGLGWAVGSTSGTRTWLHAQLLPGIEAALAEKRAGG